MFPAAKKVAFRSPLTEDVKTEKYTLKHSDIESSASTISTLDLNDVKEDDEKVVKKVEKKQRASSPQTGEKRESSDEEDDDDEDESYPTTPVAGRRKRHRQWTWTLGPVDHAPSSTEEQTSDEASSSEQKTKEGA